VWWWWWWWWWWWEVAEVELQTSSEVEVDPGKQVVVQYIYVYHVVCVYHGMILNEFIKKMK
jgi:hypothetical protein